MCKTTDLKCCKFRYKKTRSFLGFISSWALLYSHFRKLIHVFKDFFKKHCKVTMPKSMKPGSVRYHVIWLCALCVRPTWAMTTFAPWRELNSLLWAKPDYIVLPLNRMWHCTGLALCWMCRTGCAGFFTADSSTAGRADTETPAALLVHSKTWLRIGKEKLHATVPLTHPKVFTELPPLCSMRLRSAPCKVSQPSA